MSPVAMAPTMTDVEKTRSVRVVSVSMAPTMSARGERDLNGACRFPVNLMTTRQEKNVTTMP